MTWPWNGFPDQSHTCSVWFCSEVSTSCGAKPFGNCANDVTIRTFGSLKNPVFSFCLWLLNYESAFGVRCGGLMSFNITVRTETHFLNKSWILTKTLQELHFEGKQCPCACEKRQKLGNIWHIHLVCKILRASFIYLQHTIHTDYKNSGSSSLLKASISSVRMDLLYLETVFGLSWIKPSNFLYS